MSAPVRADGTRPTPLLPAGTDALAPFVAAGVLREADVQVAGAIARAVPGTADDVLLAAALCVRALGLGHVCIEIDEVAARIDADAAEADAAPDVAGEGALAALAWPEPAAWADALRTSAAVAVCDPSTGEAAAPPDPGVLRPLVFDGRRAYLERYWRYERQVGDALLGSPGTPGAPGPAAFNDAAIEAALDRCFGEDAAGTDLQRRGAAVALRNRITVLAGGPGTGKTHTVARLLGALHELSLRGGTHLQVALAAPTGKAAARMTEAVHQAAERIDLPDEVVAALRATEGSTLHRLLGHRDGITFRHDHANPLPHDVVVVDETSMVALPLMARLLDALRPEARLVLVGDPFQLASVEAGAVLGDIVGPAARTGGGAVTGPLAERIVVLERTHRFAADSAIAALAAAVRAGDVDAALDVLRDPQRPDVAWVQPGDAAAVRALRAEVLEAAATVARDARAGNAEAAHAAAVQLKVLCGTRFGPTGSFAWRDHIERRLPRLVEGMRTDERWYAGRPVIVTANDPITGVFNGDTGLVVSDGDRPVIVMAGATGLRRFATAQLAAVDTWWAMTIHKSQGSEFEHAVVSLPGATSRVLTNELLYTAVTRGRERVTVLTTEEALRTAIATPVARASGLGPRLWP